jgi:hypothetical protein
LPTAGRLEIEETALAQIDQLRPNIQRLVWLILDVLDAEPDASFSFFYELTEPYEDTKVLTGPGFKLYWRVRTYAHGFYAEVLKIEPTNYYDNPGDFIWMEFVSWLDHARHNVVIRGYYLASRLRAIRFRAPKSFRKRRGAVRY